MITWRSFEPSDLDALADLVVSAEIARGNTFAPRREEIRQMFASLGDYLIQNSTGALDGDRLIGGCTLLPDPGSNPPLAQFQGLVHPDYVRQGVGAGLFEWALERRQVLDHPRLRLQIEGANPGQEALCQRYGFRPERYFFRMGKSDVATAVAPTIPAGYALSRAGHERLRETRAAVRREFADQWSVASPEWNEQMFERNLAAGQVHPEDWLILTDASNQIVATCFVNAGRSEQDKHRGFISTIGVVPELQGTGLGRLMLTAGIHALRELGCLEAYLDVDNDNPSPALGLYERAGFKTVYTRSYWIFEG